MPHERDETKDTAPDGAAEEHPVTRPLAASNPPFRLPSRRRARSRRAGSPAALLAGLLLLTGGAIEARAQEPPAEEVETAQDPDVIRGEIPEDAEDGEALIVTPPRDELGRRIIDEEPVILAFNDVPIEQTAEFIVRTTGKNLQIAQGVRSSRFSLISDEPLSRQEALNSLFEAFLHATPPAAVVETEDWIYIDTTDMVRQYPVPVIPPEASVLERTDRAVFVNKVYDLDFASAENIAALLEEQLPDWAVYQFDPRSNQLLLLATLGQAQRVERIIEAFDRPSPAVTETYRLEWADASKVASYIEELFAPDGEAGGGGGRQPGRQVGGGRIVIAGGEAGGGTQGAAAAVEFRVSYNTWQNTVTVVADPSKMVRIRELIQEVWDVPLVAGEDIVRTYQLRYRDAIVVRDILQELIEGVSTGAGARGTPRVQVPGAAGGAEGISAEERLAGQFKFQADPTTNELIVIGRTSRGFQMLDEIIDELDHPGAPNLPLIIPLQHADAEDLATEINILLAPEGFEGELEGRVEELTTFDTAGSLGALQGTTATGGGGLEGPAAQENAIRFPWQTGREREDVAQVSPLIGKVRVMPVLRQNALMILGPEHYQQQIQEIVQALDKPGRQVLISAIIAEVELSDALELGLRFSSAGLPAGGDNQIGGTGALEATEENIFSELFDTSVLNVNVELNALLEYLETESSLRILSEPRIYTSDNEQANFFDGQSIQLTEATVIGDEGGVTQSFELLPVGIVLSVRPRITATRDVDLLVNLELSSLSPAATAAGGVIIDKRLTTTRVVVQNGQTVIISGILREQESRVKRKVPILGDLPLLGALFTSYDNETTQSELIAFITPLVVDNPIEAEELNDPYRDRLRDILIPLDDQPALEPASEVFRERGLDPGVDPDAPPTEDRPEE